MTIETLMAISVTVIAAIMALAAWIMQERSILSTDSVMNSLNMGTVPKPLLLSLCLFSLPFLSAHFQRLRYFAENGRLRSL
jgi:hypothetical protein